jgi:AraC-like DNA-binding protein
MTVVGARFHPGAAALLFGLPIKKLVDLTVRLDDLWGRPAIRLGEALADAPRPDAALEVLQRYLIRLQARSDGPDSLVIVAVRRLMPWQPVEIGELAAQLAISSSQLRRRFLATVGVGPKTLQRTLRFQGYLAFVQATSTTGGRARDRTLADVAAGAGYADHAHLSRECRRLTGLTPGELAGGRPDRCGCGHDHAASYLPFLTGRGRTARTG